MQLTDLVVGDEIVFLLKNTAPRRDRQGNYTEEQFVPDGGLENTRPFHKHRNRKRYKVVGKTNDGRFLIIIPNRNRKRPTTRKPNLIIDTQKRVIGFHDKHPDEYKLYYHQKEFSNYAQINIFNRELQKLLRDLQSGRTSMYKIKRRIAGESGDDALIDNPVGNITTSRHYKWRLYLP